MTGAVEAPRAGQRVQVLDGLRGLAVALVLIYHLHEYVPRLWGGQSAFGLTGMSAHLMSFFWVGVDLFYVLSGFFIASAVLRPATWDPAHFLRQRATRILPAYYVALLLTLLFVERQLLTGSRGWLDLGLHVIMLHNLQPWSMFGIIGPAWTLAVECAFYLLMLGLAPVWRSARGVWMLPAFIAVAWLWRASVLTALPHEQRFFCGVQLPGALDEFALGMAVAWLHQRGWLVRAQARWPALAPLLGAAGAALVSITLMYYVRLKTDFWLLALATVFSRTLLCTGFALLLAAFLLSARAPALRAVVRFSGLGWLGEVSYSTYLFHVPIILLMARAMAGTAWTSVVLIPALLLAILVAAALSHRLVEQRWHRSL